jgi:hypothetical protein
MTRIDLSGIFSVIAGASPSANVLLFVAILVIIIFWRLPELIDALLKYRKRDPKSRKRRKP